MKCILPWKVALFLGILLVSGCNQESDPEPQFKSFEEELDYLADQYVRMGAAVGIIDRQQNQHEYYFGKISRNRDIPPDEHSIFEIGSITKTFTATLLAQMILDGKLDLEDELEALLPEQEVDVPQWNGTSINLRHLATHSSGLEKSPRDSNQPLPPGYDPYDPYAAYSTAYVYDYLSNWCNLQFEPGTRYSYSNTGMGLVGHVLGLMDSTSYADVLEREILKPLGLNETTLFITGELIPLLAPGHDEARDSVSNYNAQDIFQGAGFIKSTLHDMLIFLKVQMGLLPSGLDDAIALTHEPHFEVGTVTYNDREGVYQLAIGLAWHIDVLPEGDTYYSHGGRTNGYMAYMAFDPETSTGVVILCNQSYDGAITRFGEDLLKTVNKYDLI